MPDALLEKDETFESFLHASIMESFMQICLE